MDIRLLLSLTIIVVSTLLLSTPVMSSSSSDANVDYCPQGKYALRNSASAEPTCVSREEFQRQQEESQQRLQDQGMSFSVYRNNELLKAQSPLEYAAMNKVIQQSNGGSVNTQQSGGISVNAPIQESNGVAQQSNGGSVNTQRGCQGVECEADSVAVAVGTGNQVTCECQHVACNPAAVAQCQLRGGRIEDPTTCQCIVHVTQQCSYVQQAACADKKQGIDQKTCKCTGPVCAGDDAVCTKQGGTFDYDECICTPAAPKCADDLVKACADNHGTFDSTSCICTPPAPPKKCADDLVKACADNHGTFDSTSCICTPKRCTEEQLIYCNNQHMETDPVTCQCVGGHSGGNSSNSPHCTQIEPCPIHQTWDLGICKCIQEGSSSNGGGTCPYTPICGEGKFWDDKICQCVNGKCIPKVRDACYQQMQTGGASWDDVHCRCMYYSY